MLKRKCFEFVLLNSKELFSKESKLNFPCTEVLETREKLLGGLATFLYNIYLDICSLVPIDKNLNQFAVSLRRGPSWPFTTRKKLYLALVNGAMGDEKVAKGYISLNQEHCKSLDVSLGDTILLKVFVPPLNGFDVDLLRIMVELHPESSGSTQMIMASTLGREFIKTFHHQIFTEYQRLVFAYKGSSYGCSVVEISLRESESQTTPKQGMIGKRTKVTVEVPQLLVD
ncbi:unnamed protein product [Camellia sinensis]